ncbi:MAG: STAS domain-containing protein [Rhodoferax sp.]|uniref:STAS domain-containing protein n=1 Tax=Rhodoferax sp. TaxID=50421 RepID=UPI003264D3BE
MSSHALSGASMTEVEGCLVVTLQGDISDEAFTMLYQEFSQRLVANRLSGAVLDFSGVQVLDLHEFNRVRGLSQVAGFLGAEVVFVALAPGIAAFLAQADIDISDLQFCQHMEDAFATLALHR